VSATSATRQVIKLANKRNLSLTSGACLSIALLSLLLASVTSAQVPPRSEAAQEQREEKTPLLAEVAEIDWVTQSTAYIRFSWEPLSIEFIADDGKTSTILFTEESVTYSGGLTFDESAKMFFELFWKEYILQNHLRAKCDGVVGQREE